VKIQILGIGCPKCAKLHEDVTRLCQEKGLDAEIEKVQDFAAMAAMGVMSTPALAVDGEVKITGRVPSAKELADLLTG
jgi:small redox-active disulfide protein 2